MFDPGDLVNRTIGGYQLLSVLGRGAVGTVFLGQNVAAPNQRAAVKVLIPPAQLGPKERDEFHHRFVREAKVLEGLSHPHILRLLGYGQDEETGLDYMVLPYIDGGTLANRIEAGPMPIDEAAAIITQVADALDYAHTRNMVHRDIKPANILLDQQGQVYLADFGIVKLFDTGHTTLTTEGQVMGTPVYMAPEQAQGQPIDASADIYSLGMVLYHMVTGVLPFQGNTLFELLIQIVQKTPISPRTIRPDLTQPDEAVIMQAIAKQPVKRFASAGELARAFDQGRSGQWAAGLVPYAVSAQWARDSLLSTQSRQPTYNTTYNRRPRRTGGVLVLTLLLIAGLIFALWSHTNHPATSTLVAGKAASTATKVDVKATATYGGGKGGVPTAPTDTVPPGVTPSITPFQPTNTPLPGVIATDTPFVPTNTPFVPTDTPQPTPTPTQCPYLNGGAGVTFYNGQNFSGQSYNVFFNPGQDVHFNLPNYITGNLQSIKIDRAAWHVVTFNNPNSGGNLAHWDSDVLAMPDGAGYKNSASAEVYLRRSC